jgi:hypothetical protein
MIEQSSTVGMIVDQIRYEEAKLFNIFRVERWQSVHQTQKNSVATRKAAGEVQTINPSILGHITSEGLGCSAAPLPSTKPLSSRGEITIANYSTFK